MKTTMFGHDTLFLYFTRRAQQEQIAAINARSAPAAAIHNKLSRLYTARAALAASGKVADQADDPVARSCANPYLAGIEPEAGDRLES